MARFDGGTISSDGGALLLAEVEQRTRIVERFASCFVDRRDPTWIEHGARELAMQRVLGLYFGYEDLSDHDTLRSGPLLSALAGKRDPRTALAGKSTLSRLELSTSADDRYKRLALDTSDVDRLLVDVFLESHTSAPRSIVIDLDGSASVLKPDRESGDSCRSSAVPPARPIANLEAATS